MYQNTNSLWTLGDVAKDTRSTGKNSYYIFIGVDGDNIALVSQVGKHLLIIKTELFDKYYTLARSNAWEIKEQ